MPGKSRYSKNKQHRYTKKSRAMQRQAAPVNAVAIPAPDVKTENLQAEKPSTSPIKNTINEYSYIGGELKKIGVLAVIIIVILIVLSRVLS